MSLLEKWQSEIPSTSKIMAIVLLLINIFLPGIGTLIMFCMNQKPNTLLVGLLQFFTAFIIIGWIWSIWWGVICLSKAK